MPDDILNHLGSHLRNARNGHGLTQQQLASKTGVSIRHIANIEKGIMNPSFVVLHALVTCLGVSPNDLFYSKLSEEEREINQLTGYYKACPPDDRILIMKTVQCLAYELMDRCQTANEDEKA